MFTNVHAIAIVIGGTTAAAMVCFPFKHILSIMRIMFKASTGGFQKETIGTINEIVELSQMMVEDKPLEEAIAKVRSPFLRESLQLAVDGTIPDNELEAVLFKRVEIQNEKYKQEGITYKIIGKFPPAFGLIGTTLGMISLLQGLGGESAFEKLGPAMSVSLTATFYGLVVANLFLIPIGENLSFASQHDLTRRRIIVEGVMLLKHRKHPLIVEECLKSYLSPADRNQMKKVDI
ncbi:MAG: hypothetical protein A2504_04710 [Bdellovibrionales bacterium RIFOXYD12_FULL_39_22]|nr:MAG: hypothetical protein A2385_07115 [Bdellovibrionales bacterium RIFOXYB1_FULL_39_21]OFZ42153.1 MAG: hypothetical protein A2485_09085 [Bdellovibrionales bacterium RIFOXYC12_FULL_39_17]OFZ50974.1 MAG: hypothetical protein A2404_06035 [Bdellovibrionales bacterium RIFOXYC1_FULL_39_130]OFZ74333.1 MAG: hypothetical protein A2451_02315 [Bdellovibrionales bacterium RIFOXYC2_FULL_39_8]OFZ78197.1 MAG: hypothetical protein A2560_01205 [Bdellovibrionales bacterium RIFOXYD1_FULL_39_84]OFZ93815.1 MAG: